MLTVRPGMQPSVLRTVALTDVTPNIIQVLKDEGSARTCGINYAPTQNVVAITTEAVDLPADAPEVALRGLGAFRLEFELESEVSRIDFPPAAFTEELVVREDCGADKPKVYTDNLTTIDIFHVRDRDNCVQPEPILTSDKVSRVESSSRVEDVLIVGWYTNRKHLPSTSCRKANGGWSLAGYLPPSSIRAAGRQHAITAGIVTNRKKLRMWNGNTAAFALESQHRLHGFSGANSRGADKLRRQSWILSPQWVVSRFVQLHAVLLSMIPAVSRYCVETSGVLVQRVQQHWQLFGSWCDLESNRTLHAPIVSYAVRYYNRRTDGASAPSEVRLHGGTSSRRAGAVSSAASCGYFVTAGAAEETAQTFMIAIELGD